MLDIEYLYQKTKYKIFIKRTKLKLYTFIGL